jgi:hypothetical protein
LTAADFEAFYKARSDELLKLIYEAAGLNAAQVGDSSSEEGAYQNGRLG